MAATDIQYGGFDPVLYTPDFTFLKYVLDKKTSNYEKGLKSVSSAYNSLKRELTDPTNVEKRDQYLKDAQSQLQKIASSDLSLQQNVNFANSIFDPIATDKAISFDAYHTERIKNELAKEDAWMNSEDPEVRKKYNAEIKEWVNRDLESLRNGKGDIANYKVQGRSAQAYVDAQDILADEAKRQGFKVKADELGQPYIVTVEGGPGFTKNYKQFANEVLSNDQVYQRQLGILGQNRSEKILEQYRTDKDLAPIWANRKPEEIYADYAAKSYDKHKVDQKEYIESLNKNLVAEDADIKAALNGPDGSKYIQGATDVANGNNTTPNAQLYLSLKEKADGVNSLQGKLKDLQDDYDKSFGNDAGRAEYLKSFTDNPAGYLANLQFKNDITRFSNIKSSSFTRTFKEDRAYVDIAVARTNLMGTVNKIQDTQIDNALNQAKFEELVRMDDAKLAKMGKKKVQNADGTISVVDTGTGGDISFVDISGTQLNTVQALNQLKDNITVASAKALGNITDNFGAFSMLQSMGLDPTKVGTLRGMFSRYYTAEDKKTFKPTAAENQALKEAYTAMWGFSKNNPNNTFLQQERANYGKQPLTIDRLPDLLDRAMTGYKANTEEEKNIKRSMAEYKANSQKIFDANIALEKGKKAVISQLENKTEFHDMLKWENGKAVGLIDENDIYNRIKGYKIKEDGGLWFDQKSGLSDKDLKDISKAYIDGTLTVDHVTHPILGRPAESTFEWNGKKYNIENLSRGSYNYAFPLTSKEYQSKLSKINERIPIPIFEQAAGNVSASPFFKVSGELKQDVMDDLAKVTLTNSNIYDYSEGTSTASQVKPDIQKKVRDAILGKDNVVDVSLFTSSPLNGGGQAVSITFKTIEGSDSKPAPEWAGKTYYFPISVTPQSPKIFHAFNEINEVSEYAPYQKEGKAYNMDAFQAEGVKAVLYPRQPGATDGTVELWYKPYNPTTRTYSDVWEKHKSVSTYDLSKRSFPEIKDDIYNAFIYPYVNGTITYNNQQQANTIASGGTVLTADGLYKTLRPY